MMELVTNIAYAAGIYFVALSVFIYCWSNYSKYIGQKEHSLVKDMAPWGRRKHSYKRRSHKHYKTMPV